MSAVRDQFGAFTRPGEVQEPRIPMSALAPLIDRWAKQNTISGDGLKNGTYHSGGTSGSGWLEPLAKKAGLNARFIRSIRRGWYENHRTKEIITHVKFDTADRLTTAMECNWEWTEGGSLSEWYGPLSIRPYERHLAGVE